VTSAIIRVIIYSLTKYLVTDWPWPMTKASLESAIRNFCIVLFLNLLSFQNNFRLVFFFAVIEIEAQIKHMSSLEAITELPVHRGVTVAFSFFRFIT